MSMVINNNIPALRVQRNLNSSYASLSKSVERLSSGLRVNSAADDSAGLAIRELMRADISALNQGTRNANDAISLIQTADGAMQVIDEKLIRMKELAEQASTGTYDSIQRLIIDSEYQQMASEITRIAQATSFNGINLLNGDLSNAPNATATNYDGSGLKSTGELKVHFGPGNDSATDFYFIRINEVTASSLGVGNASDPAQSTGYAVSTQEGASAALEALTTAIASKDTIRANLGSMQNRLESTITNLQVQAENLQAAESRVSDIDVAAEMTTFVRNQILAQSGVAMLAQANAMPRLAMQLIG